MPEEHDRFADELDRMVAGHPSAGGGDLAVFAREVQGLGAEQIEDAQRDRIRRRLMQHANSASTPTTGGAGPLSQPTLTDPAMTNPWVRRRPAAAMPTGWRGHMVKAQTAIAIMTAVTLLIIGAAWYTNQQGSDEPGSMTTRYAAAPTEAVGGSHVLSMQEPDPRGTPEMREELDAEWWTWPANEGCDADAFARSESEEVAYPEREYLPLGTPDRADAEAAARLMRATQSCGLPYTVEIFLTGRAYEERILEGDLSIVFTKEAQYIEIGRTISEAFPIQDPRAFGRLATEEPIPATPSAMERWTGGPPATNPYAPFSAVAIPSHAVLLPDGRIAIPESLIAFEGVEDLSYRGAPATWERHVTSLIVLSNASGQWLVDEQLPFCVGDCDFFWSEQEAMAERLHTLATEEAGVDATPVSTPEAEVQHDTPLLELLSALPAPLALAEGGTLPGWTYADLDQRFEDLGLTDGQLADDPMLPLATNAYAPLASTTNLFNLAADEAFVEAIGFNPLTVDQVLVTGRAPDVLTLLRGEWDEDSLTAAWEDAGYTQQVTVDGVTIWSLDSQGMVDPQHPIQARMFQQLNNVAILDGGILAYAGYSATIELVIQTQTGEMASALDEPMLLTLFEAVPEQTVSSIGFSQPGSALYDLGEIAANPNISPEDRERIEASLRDSREAVGPMPEYRGVVFSFVGGTNGDGETVVQIGAFSDDQASQIASVLEWRWQHLTSPQYQRNLDSIMPLVEATTDGTTVTLRFESESTPQMWLQMVQGDGLIAFAVDAGLPVGTPEASPVTAQAIPEEDADWWTWPNADECRPEEFPEDTLDTTDYPERAYLPLSTPVREDAEEAARVARTAMACRVHYSTPPFSSSRYQEESNVLSDDPYWYGQSLLEQNENGRAIAEDFPITDPTAFGHLTDEEPSQENPPGIGLGPPIYATNRYEPFTAVYIPSQAVQLADGRIAIPESLIAMEDSADLAYRGDPATWVRHYALLVVLSDASGTWHIDEFLPFCIGPDCNVFWEQNEELAHRVLAGATPEAPIETPTASPEAIAPVDDRIWLACPDYTGPYTYASRDGVASDVALPGAFDPRSSWGPAEPPSIPCEYPKPMPPEIGNPIPLD